MREAPTETEGVEATDDPAVINAILEELAKLDPVEYDRRREAEAKRLGIRVGTLDQEVTKHRPNGEDGNGVSNDLGLFEPNPWPDEIDGNDLLERVVGGLCRHVVMPDHAAEAIALWVVHAHAFEFWRHTPRLGVLAPEKECGKSTLLDVLSCLTPRAIKTENLSTATMFRVVDQFKPTLLIDEVDTFLRDNEELRGALNAGHAEGGRHLRCDGDDNKVRAFKTFAPAALAGIGRLPETLADRSIIVTLQKRKPDEYVQDYREDRADHLRALASQIARWVHDHETELRQAEPAMPDGLHNRRADKWRPLLAIADAAGGDWPETARQAAVALSVGASDETSSIRVLLLSDIRDIFQASGRDKLFSEEIVERLHEIDARPWPEFGKQQKPISKNQVANQLKPFKITTGTVRRGDKTGKGYKRNSFQDAFDRYLPPFQNVTTSQPAENRDKSAKSKRHNEEDVTFENPPKATNSAGCDVVTFRNPDTPGGWGSDL